jgi:OOP family OmpA-OmpF porin
MPQEQTENGHASANASAYAELRRLLLGPEQDQIDALQQRIDDPVHRAEDVGGVLAEAVRWRSGRDRQLGPALQPIVGETLRLYLQRHPEVVSDIMFPFVGSMVRRAVASALGSLIRSLNQIHEQSLTWRSLTWRFEAARTGKSYGEIVVARSLLYRVEQVFLIHSPSGLLLQHRVAQAVVIRDANLVSGMLTAIQDFVRDSFGDGQNEQLETMRVGEFDVWIVQTPHATLAAVVRGAAPANLRNVFEDALNRICHQKAEELRDFQGDVAPFESCQEQLQACLLGQARTRPLSIPLFWWLLAAAVLLVLAAWIGLGIRDQRHWDAYVNELRNEPGIVITAAEKHGANYFVSGLRDALAADPARLVAASNLPLQRVETRFEPYQSLEPRFVAARAAEKLQRQTVLFATDRTDLTPEQTVLLIAIAENIRELIDSATRAGQHPAIEIAGHADDSGRPDHNLQLAQKRADVVRQGLIAAGVPAGKLTAKTGEPPRAANSELDRALNRSVTFRLVAP